MAKTIYSTASVDRDLRGALGEVRINGLVLPGGLAPILLDTALWTTRSGMLAGVAYWEQASIAFGRDELLEPAQQALRTYPANRLQVMPAAVVTSTEHLPMFKQWASLMMQAGVPRAIFTSAEQAHEWAARQAQVQEYWLAQHRRAQSAFA